MQDLEKYGRWRMKIIIFSVIIFFMLLGFVRQCRAATWGDVVNDYMAYVAQYPSSSVWVENVSGGLQAFRIWKRDGASNTVGVQSSWEMWYPESGTSLCTQMTQSCTTYCDGLEDCTEHRAQIDAACPSDPELLQDWNFIDSVNVVNCRDLDTLLHLYIITASTCQYHNLIVGTSGDLALNLSMTSTCESCIPIGSYLQYQLPNYHMNSLQTGGVYSDTERSCFFVSVIGDPSGIFAVDSTIAFQSSGDGSDLNLSSGGSYTLNQGNNGSGSGTGSGTGSGSGTGLVNLDTSSTSTSNGNGTSTIVSTITGSGVNVTQTQTVSIPNLSPFGTYSNTNIEGAAVGDFGQLATQFANDLKGTGLIQHFSLAHMVDDLGGGTSLIEMPTAAYGMQTFDLSSSVYQSGLAIIRGVLLLLGGFLAIRIVIMKK